MRRSPSSRKKAERRGRVGEVLAALYLRAQFFAIKSTRFKTPVGEIDLVAERGDLTIFVEVKVRASKSQEYEALAAVNKNRISRAANFYLSKNPAIANRSLRFDVIFLAPWSWPRHVMGAFDFLE